MPVSLRSAVFRCVAPLLAAGVPAVFTGGCCPAQVVAPEPGPYQPTPRQVSRLDPAVPDPSADALPETGARYEVTPFTTELSVKVGDLLTHTFARHPSVGRDGVAQVSGDAVVLLRRDDIMKHPDRQDMPGGDASSSTWVFKAVARGTATLRIEHLFRGDVEHRIEVAVTVD